MRLPGARLLMLRCSGMELLELPLRWAALAELLRPASPAADGEEAALAGLGPALARPLLAARLGRGGDSGSSFLGGGLASSATLQQGGAGQAGLSTQHSLGTCIAWLSGGAGSTPRPSPCMMPQQSSPAVPTSCNPHSSWQETDLGSPPFLPGDAPESPPVLLPGLLALPGLLPLPPAGRMPPACCLPVGVVLRALVMGRGDTTPSSSSGLLVRRTSPCEEVLLLVGRAMGMMSPMCVGPLGCAW